MNVSVFGQRLVAASIRFGAHSPKETHVSPKETVIALYAAFASGDPKRISDLLHEDVVWVAPPGNATQVALGLGRAGDAGPPDGSNNLGHREIVQFMAHNFARFFLRPKNEFRAMVAEGPIVFAEHRISAELPNGRHYVNDYCFAYEVQDGKVLHMREYMDTRGGWAQVFGGEEPKVLLEFVER
jgi:ketosteroid isomerase-like protein